jgi:hypothetical protein
MRIGWNNAGITCFAVLGNKARSISAFGRCSDPPITSGYLSALSHGIVLDNGQWPGATAWEKRISQAHGVTLAV